MESLNLRKKITAGSAVLQNSTRQTVCQSNIKTYGNIWVREIIFEKKGDTKDGHKHEFDHLHFLSKGSVSISVYSKGDGDVLILRKSYYAPSWIKVPKDHYHDIVALEDDSVGYCIQALVTENGDVADTNYAYDNDWINVVKEFEEENNFSDEVLKNK